MNQRETETSEQVLKLRPKIRRRIELLSWMTQDGPSLRKFERRPTWQKKTAIGP